MSADESNDASEWTTVVRHKPRAKPQFTEKHLSILEQVKEGSLDPKDAVNMFSSSAPSYKRPYNGKPYFHVTRGGSVALYGFHKRPLVLYANRWLDLKTYLNSGELEKFLDEHSSEFRKPNKEWVPPEDDKHKDKPYLRD